MENRKQDHIQLTEQAQITTSQLDSRFYYEPLSEISDKFSYEDNIFDNQMQYPLWMSSMTGGLELGKHINENLAKVCAKYGLGMGLGSCRVLLENKERLSDFAVRQLIGEQPLYANLGIAQIAELRERQQLARIQKLIDMLDADGLIVHVNPLQEFAQPEGDALRGDPIDHIRWLLDHLDYPIIVKEVGQGIGPHGLSRLMALPLKAIDTASAGGTNFALLELLRTKPVIADALGPLAHVGHSAGEMVELINNILMDRAEEVECSNFIISGGIKSFLDGYYCLTKLKASSIFGQASSLLKYAKSSYEELDMYVDYQLRGYRLATQVLKVK